MLLLPNYNFLAPVALNRMKGILVQPPKGTLSTSLCCAFQGAKPVKPFEVTNMALPTEAL